MNKFILGILVIGLGLAIGWYSFSGKIKLPGLKNQTVPTPVITQTNEGEPSTENLYTYTEVPTTPGQSGDETKGGVANPTGSPVSTKSAVTYTDSGFMPNTLTVKLNTAVTFVNKSTGLMWVASAPHPTHDLLPDFDQKKSVSKNGTYEFVFAKVGTWKYHNHELPEKTGTIIVTQ